jgi:hypothetical protein
MAGDVIVRLIAARNKEAQAMPVSSQHGPEWMIVIRVYGNILYAVGQWGGRPGAGRTELEPAHLDAWLADCARHGVTAVLWRANCAGTLTYPSRHAALAGEPPLPFPNRGMGVAVVEQGWTPEDWNALGAQCRRFHTLRAAVQAAHRHGLRLYLDFATFDMVGSWCTRADWPAGGERSFDPDLWLWSRDGKERLAGLPCYADPRLLALRLAELGEAMDCGVDGVVLGFFSHVDGFAGEQRCWFGYNPGVAEEYERRHGTDPRCGEVDPHRLYALHGEYYTQFVRRAGDLVRGRGGKLLGSARTDGIHGWGSRAAGEAILGRMEERDLRDGKSELPLASGLYLEWEKWAAAGWVDGLIFWAPWERGFGIVQAARKKTGVPVYLFRKFLGWGGQVRSPHSLEGYHREIQAVRQGALDGYCLHLSVMIDHAQATPNWREVLRA